LLLILRQQLDGLKNYKLKKNPNYDPEESPLEMGNYFGRWCVKAVVAVKVFNFDDSLCLDHEHFPGDLLRPKVPPLILTKKMDFFEVFLVFYLSE